MTENSRTSLFIVCGLFKMLLHAIQQPYTRGCTDMKTVNTNFYVSFPQNTLEKLFCPQLFNWQMKIFNLPLIQRKILIAVLTAPSPAHCNLLSFCCLCS